MDSPKLSIHDRLAKVQSELKAPKGQRNTFGNYNYRSCEDILEAVKPLLKEAGLVLTITDDIVEVGGRVYVKAMAGVSIEDGGSIRSISCSAFARESEEKKGMDAAQITGAASSYARKYALNGLFCIDDTKDDDTRENTDQKKPLVKPEVTDKASSGDVVRIAQLCKETKTEIPQLYGHFGVVNVPTKDQAKRMIAALEKKLGDQLDAAAQA